MPRPKILVLEHAHETAMACLAEFASVDLRLGLTRPEILAAVADVDAVVVRSVVQIDRELIDQAGGLRVVGRAGTGTDNIDLEYARQRGLTVVTTPGANAETTADFAVAQILCLVRNLYLAQAQLGAGDFRRHRLTGRELSQLTIGIVGLGCVGRAVARRLLAFGSRIIGYDPAPAAPDDPSGIERMASVAAVIAVADVLTLHAELNSSSRNLIDGRLLAKARPGLLLVNTARARMVEDDALIEALDSGRVAWAALDVVEPEPDYDSPEAIHSRHPLITHPRVVYTPHMAASTSDAQERIGLKLATGIREAFGA